MSLSDAAMPRAGNRERTAGTALDVHEQSRAIRGEARSCEFAAVARIARDFVNGTRARYAVHEFVARTVFADDHIAIRRDADVVRSGKLIGAGRLEEQLELAGI